MTDSKESPVEVPSQFAPKFRAKFKLPLTADEDIWRIDTEELPTGDLPADQAPAIRSLRLPPSLEPTRIPEAWGQLDSSRQRRPIRVIAFLASALMVGGAMMLLWAHNEQPPGVDNEDGKGSLLSRLSALVVGDVQQAPSAAPHLVVTAGHAAIGSDEASALGLAVDGTAEGAQLVIGGFAVGSQFAVGRSIGQSAWSVPASQVEKAVLTPPRGFVGTMDIAATLVLANGSLADRKMVRLEWLPKTAGVTPSEPLISRRLDPNELNALMSRGNALIATGDLAGARLVYQRAAEGGDARAAFTLAETFDPIVLESLGETGLAPSVAMARTWYRKAKDLGSREASERLERLANRLD
jgi:hypothetical protein